MKVLDPSTALREFSRVLDEEHPAQAIGLTPFYATESAVYLNYTAIILGKGSYKVYLAF